MNENPDGLPKNFVDSVLKEITPKFLTVYPEPDRFLHKYADFIGVDFNNVTVAGVEMEFKKDLFNRTLQDNGVSKLSLGINGAYTYTYAKVPLATDSNGSQLEGAAPWIVNADLSYLYKKGQKSFTNTLVANYFSDRIHTIGTEGYQDIVENGIPTLDFISSAQLNKYITISLKARNLLNSAHQLTRKSSSPKKDDRQKANSFKRRTAFVETSH
jgi:hypothetical protein